MATFRASRWTDGLASSSFNNLIGKLDAVAETLADSTEISDGFLITATSSQLVVGLIPSGRLEILGAGLDGLGRSLTINQLSVTLPGASLSASGALTLSLAADGSLSPSGQLSRITFSGGGVSISLDGSYRFTFGGDLFAINATENLRLTDGTTLTARTNASGQYTSLELSGSSGSFSASGVWNYSSLFSMDDVLAGSDRLIGSVHRDFMPGGRGNDSIEGGADIDTAIFRGHSSGFTTSFRGGDTWIVSSASQGTDTLTGVERVRFDNKTIALDMEGNAGQTYRLYKAAFDRQPDLGGLGFWIATMDNGLALDKVAREFINSQEFRTLYGVNPSNATFVRLLYNNVLDREPDPSGFANWLGHLDSGRMSRQEVLLGFSESTENKVAVTGLIGGGIDFTVWQG